MFKKNLQHEQTTFFSAHDELPESLQKKLKKGWSALFYKTFFSKIDEKTFSPLYHIDNGRANFPANILFALEVIKEMWGYSDETLLENYHFNMVVRNAVGLQNFQDHQLCPRTLYHWRARLAEHDLETKTCLLESLFEEHRDALMKMLKVDGRIQRTDSVMIRANIKRMNRLMLFHKVLSNLVHLIVRNDLNVSTEILNLIQEKEDGFVYRLPREKTQETLEKVGVLILELVSRPEVKSACADEKAFLDAHRLLKEQCTVSEQAESIELKSPAEISSSSMQNPADTDATYRKKKEVGHQGYSCVATETCTPENTVSIITSVDLVPNNIDDAVVLDERLVQLKNDTGLETMVADGGFVGKNTIKTSAENHIELVASAIRGAQPDADLMTSNDFIKTENGAVKSCPMGEVPVESTIIEGAAVALFSCKVCASCVKNTQCPAFLVSHSRPRMVIDERRKFYDNRRELLHSEEYRRLCRLRPAVEGLMEKLRPGYLKGRTLFRGLVKVKMRMVLRAIGVNFRRGWLWILRFFYFRGEHLTQGAMEYKDCVFAW
jgi:hypothetical protein